MRATGPRYKVSRAPIVAAPTTLADLSERPGSCSGPVSDAVSESLRLRERLELLERVVLDLANTLARDSERLPDLLERARLRAVEPVPQLDDPPLTLGESGERQLDVLSPQGEGCGIERRLRRLVGN